LPRIFRKGSNAFQPSYGTEIPALHSYTGSLNVMSLLIPTIAAYCGLIRNFTAMLAPRSVADVIPSGPHYTEGVETRQDRVALPR